MHLGIQFSISIDSKRIGVGGCLIFVWESRLDRVVPESKSSTLVADAQCSAKSLQCAFGGHGSRRSRNLLEGVAYRKIQDHGIHELRTSRRKHQ